VKLYSILALIFIQNACSVTGNLDGRESDVTNSIQEDQVLVDSAPALNELRPFVSDGCSGMPDGRTTDRSPMTACCIEHDKDYWVGGSLDARKAADAKFTNCIENVSNKFKAGFVKFGVRVGGILFWGNGWKYRRGDGELTEVELTQVKTVLPDNYLEMPIIVDRARLRHEVRPSVSGSE
jgi:hypothetical protein